MKLQRTTFFAAALLALGGCSSDGGTGSTTGGGTNTNTGACKVTGEVEPNEDRDHAVALTSGKKVSGCDTDNDNDYYSFTAPADAGGGYVKISGTGKDASFTYVAWTASDNVEIFKHTAANKGAIDDTYIAVAGGAKLTFNFGTDAPSLYDVTVTYYKVDDAYEPNDSKEAAKPLDIGKKIQGKFFCGFKTGKQEGFEDWFKIVATKPGKPEIVLGNVATNMGAVVTLYDDKGEKLGEQGSDNQGASIDYKYPDGNEALPPATYLVRVAPDGGEKWADEKIPDHFTRPYDLTVTWK